MSDAGTEQARLDADANREQNWKRWGPYLSERQWATVREDYEGRNDCWRAFPYEMSLSRAYRWGEDGLLGITDRECRLCFALALWNGRDPHLKERLFGLTNPEGNHSEDVKEIYFYLDATPTSSYLKGQYRYPQAQYPYEKLRAEARRRGRESPEFELLDTGVFDGNRFWDVVAEYAKAGPDDLCIRLTVHNRGDRDATLDLLPTLWFRNTWCWGSAYEEGEWPKPAITPDHGGVVADHATLGKFRLVADGQPEWLFTDNETNAQLLFGSPNAAAHVKDAFHRYVVNGENDAVSRDGGTKAAARYTLHVPAGGSATVKLRLVADKDAKPDAFADFDATFAARIREADEFYAARIPQSLPPDRQQIARQAYAGLIWSEQFYHYVVPDWVTGDKPNPLPPDVQDRRINRDWPHLFSRDVLSVPDKWEYPAFFAWDLAFHMVPMARIDPHFAKAQLLLLLREWYLHPNGQLPAFEYDLSDVNPPVHAWAVWEVFARSGASDHQFLERCFHKLLMNFNWWVNRKDADGKNVFAGGFLGMDNIGVFDRSRPLPTGGTLQQADGTAWMGFYCTCMLRIALELARHNPSYEDIASKFFEHFVAISESINHLDGVGLWDEADGFYYDRLKLDGEPSVPLKVRSLTGFIPLLAVQVLSEACIHPHLKEFEKRLIWFMKYREGGLKHAQFLEIHGEKGHRHRLLTLVGRNRLQRAVQYMLDEAEFLSPFGVRSLSRHYLDHPYTFRADGDDTEYRVQYVPGDMREHDFGGNSNWRGPVWFPINYLLLEALERFDAFFGDEVTVEFPTGSGKRLRLGEVAHELSHRLGSLFVADESGRRPSHGADRRWADDPLWKDHLLFYEYFDGDTGRGLGANHQTGWTALVACLLERCAGAAEGPR